MRTQTELITKILVFALTAVAGVPAQAESLAAPRPWVSIAVPQESSAREGELEWLLVSGRIGAGGVVDYDLSLLIEKCNAPSHEDTVEGQIPCTPNLLD